MRKTLLGGLAVLLLVGGGIWLGMRLLMNEVKDTATRPYRSASGLVIAAVSSEYASEGAMDGSILLKKPGAAAGLAGFYKSDAIVPGAALQKALATMTDGKYEALEAPKEPCRSDAETSTTTLGELTFPGRKVTLWTCTMTKKSHAYFLVWASSSDDERKHLSYQLKTSQLVSNKLCAVNVINGGCSPDAAALVSAVVASARN